MNIGIFIPNWIGDAVMATPALRALHNHFGSDNTLIGIMKPYVAPVYDGSQWFNERWLYDLNPRGQCMTRKELIGRMRKLGFDIVLLLTNSLGTALIAWLGGAQERIGYARDMRSALLTTRLNPVKRGGILLPYPTLDSYLALAYAAGCPAELSRIELQTTPDDELRAESVWIALGLSKERGHVTLNSSGAYGAAKLWPDEHFARLAYLIASECGHDVLVLCGPAERKRAESIARLARHPRVFSLAGQELSIGLTKACVRRSKLLVSTDSGPRHFAAAFGVPVISLFGPTHIAWSDTHYSRETHLQIPVDCGPCQKPVCPLKHHKCMKDLSVDLVFRAVLEQLNTHN